MDIYKDIMGAGAGFPSEAHIAGFGNPSAFRVETQSHSIFTALALIEKNEIQIIPQQYNHCLLFAAFG